jgi:Transposase DDE domain group 1
MLTECNPELFEFARVEGRVVGASFNGGRITSDAGALLLGATDRVLNLTQRLAACFKDGRDPAYTEHAMATLVMQRVVAIALGYEDLHDHDELRHDPIMAVLAQKLAASRADCAPLAGKSTLNRLECSTVEATRYHQIAVDPDAMQGCSSICSSMPTTRRRRRSHSTSTPPTIRCPGIKRDASSTATTTVTAICRCISSAGGICWRRRCAALTAMAQLAQLRN